MKRRAKKKLARKWMDNFSKSKIPLVFRDEQERRQYVSAWARQYIGQTANFPELKGVRK